MKVAGFALSFAALTAIGAAATIPVAERAAVPGSVITCGPDETYVINKNGKTIYRPAASGFGNTIGCVPKNTTNSISARSVLPRQDPEYDTKVELYDEDTRVSYYFFINDERTNPPQFNQLFDSILGECCGTISCRESCNVCAYAAEGASPFPPDQVCLKAGGEFANQEMRDNFFTLLREAFTRAVRSETLGDLNVDEWGPEYLVAVSGFGDASGFSMTLEFSYVTDTPGCTPLVDKINSFGALVPQLGPVFGLAGAVCGVL